MWWTSALVVWLIMAAAMVAHGALRERLLTPRAGELTAHQISCFTGCLVIIGVTYAALPWLDVAGALRRQLWTGTMWVGLTLAFEFLFGHWVAGHSWSRLLGDYNVRRGRLWVVVLACTFLAPCLASALWRWRLAA